jgi:peptide/nickel transport system substrate-binding protein
MAEGGGAAPPPGTAAKRGMGWRLWAVIAVVIILVVAGAAYYLTRPSGGPTRDTSTIVYYMQSEPISFDSADTYDLWSFVTLQNTYDTLVGYDRDTLTLVPDLATSWDVSTDGLNYTFHLRENVKFADGSDFTANDVYASFKRILIWGAPTTGVDWIINQNLDKTNIPGALWVKDAHTIQMNLTQPYAGFLKTLGTVEPSAIMSAAWISAHAEDRPGNTGEVNEYIQTHSMGTAPYVLDSWAKGTEMVLVKNEHYWRGWTGTEPTKIVLKFTTDASSRVEAVRTKAADIADLPLTNVADVKGIAGVVAQGNDTVKSELVAINVTNPDFVDPQVRQALSWAFDYNGTIANAYAGYASLLPGPIPKGMQYFDVQRQWYYQNLTKAEALLDASGHPKATTGANAGFRFNGTAFRLVADGTQLEERQTAQLFQTTLQGIGIKTTLTITPTTSAWDTIRGSGTYDFFVAHWVLDYLDADDYVTPMVVSAANGGDYWTTGFVNDTIDQYAVAAKSEQSTTQRAADYQVVWQTSMDNPNMIWFCQQQYVPVHQDYIHGFWFNPVTWYNFYFYQKT